MKIACCILSYGITKGMKSFGPIGMLKKNKNTKELILHQIENLRKIFGTIDIYVITGFGEEKIYKKLESKKYVKIISNKKYTEKNYGYALKLFLERIKNNLDDYYGVFFVDSNVLLKQLKNKKRNNSWLVAQKHKQTRKNNKLDFLGINAEDIYLKYLFYNIGNISWCKSFYLTQRDVKSMIEYIDSYHDNMFLFEVLNKSVEKLNVKISINQIISNQDYIEIHGIKDKNKIK